MANTRQNRSKKKQAPERSRAPLVLIVMIALSALLFWLSVATPEANTMVGSLQGVLRGLTGSLTWALPVLLLWLGVIDEPLKLLYNSGAMMLGMVYALLPFMITSIYNSVEKLDWSVIEAARDLGASPAKAFLTVTVPLTVPGIVAGCVLVFVPSMGLFFISDLLGGAKSLLLGNLIKNELMQARNWPMGATLSIAMLLFTFAFIGIYKKVTGEKTLGGIK